MKPNPIRPRWRKVIADLWASKTRTLLVVASIAVGVTIHLVTIKTYRGEEGL